MNTAWGMSLFYVTSWATGSLGQLGSSCPVTLGVHCAICTMLLCLLFFKKINTHNLVCCDPLNIEHKWSISSFCHWSRRILFDQGVDLTLLTYTDPDNGIKEYTITITFCQGAYHYNLSQTISLQCWSRNILSAWHCGDRTFTIILTLWSRSIPSSWH
jgi:hypothetical protein